MRRSGADQTMAHEGTQQDACLRYFCFRILRDRSGQRYNGFMTRDNIQAELDREPFARLRLHLASSKTLTIKYPNSALMMEHAMLILHRIRPRSSAIGNYDVINLRLIEKVEQIKGRSNGKAKLA